MAPSKVTVTSLVGRPLRVSGSSFVNAGGWCDSAVAVASSLNPSYLSTESSDLRVQRGRGGHVDDARRATSNVTVA